MLDGNMVIHPFSLQQYMYGIHTVIFFFDFTLAGQEACKDMVRLYIAK
jgi:hypothetical protein